jgi:hypothetical protein
MFYSTEQTENVKPLGANLPMMMAGEMALGVNGYDLHRLCSHHSG